MTPFKRNKRGIMGIGTLIIFIATILVAAVAAAVLISTSNVLQQRSLLVGQEARKTITDGIDVFSILAKSNYTQETINNYEILVRLSPGSDPLQLRKFDIEILTNKVHLATQLNYPDDTSTNIQYPASDMADGDTAIFAHDLDDDGDYEEVILNNTHITVNLSRDGLAEPIPLGVTLAADIELEVPETAIAINDMVYGTIEIVGNATGAAEIQSQNITIREFANECRFDLLPPEESFCYQVMIGNDDFVLDSREKIKFLIKTSNANALSVGEDIMFIFASEKGRLTESRARAPDVLVYDSVRIWPLE